MGIFFGGGGLGTRALGAIYFIFMKFLAKILPNNRFLGHRFQIGSCRIYFNVHIEQRQRSKKNLFSRLL